MFRAIGARHAVPVRVIGFVSFFLRLAGRGGREIGFVSHNWWAPGRNLGSVRTMGKPGRWLRNGTWVRFAFLEVGRGGRGGRLGSFRIFWSRGDPRVKDRG